MYHFLDLPVESVRLAPVLEWNTRVVHEDFHLFLAFLIRGDDNSPFGRISQNPPGFQVLELVLLVLLAADILLFSGAAADDEDAEVNQKAMKLLKKRRLEALLSSR